MRKVQLLVSALLLVLLLAACAPTAGPVPAPQAPPAKAPVPAPAVSAAPAKPALAKAGWEVKWDETLAAAKKEGALVLYTALGGEQRHIVAGPFTSKYGVSVEAVAGSPSALYPRIAAEQRAGIYAADVWLCGGTSFVDLKDAADSLEPALILPELTDPELMKKAWYFGEAPWANKAHTMLVGVMDLKHFMTVNTSLVKPSEITSYRNLLDPKWKGKISLNDPRVAGNGNMWFSVALETGDVDVNFMRELATKQELFVTRDWRLQVDWLARGKHAIGIATDVTITTGFIDIGAQIESFVVGTPAWAGGTSGTAMLKRAPHLNAAKLFINWLFSKEGATFQSRAEGAQSQRLDVPIDHLRPGKVVKPGLKIFSGNSEEFSTKKNTSYRKLAEEVFASF